MSREPFLTRWSRRKLTARNGDAVEPESPAARSDDPVEPVSPSSPADPETPAAKPELPLIDSISLETGVAAFFRPEVEEGLRRQALKKLFRDPHFNTMDGLDVYIDDYSKPNPIPPDVLERLVRAQTWFRDPNAESAKAGKTPPQSDLPAAPVADMTGVAESLPKTEDPSQVGG